MDQQHSTLSLIRRIIHSQPLYELPKRQFRGHPGCNLPQEKLLIKVAIPSANLFPFTFLAMYSKSKHLEEITVSLFVLKLEHSALGKQPNSSKNCLG